MGWGEHAQKRTIGEILEVSRETSLVDIAWNNVLASLLMAFVVLLAIRLLVKNKGHRRKLYIGYLVLVLPLGPALLVWLYWRGFSIEEKWVMDVLMGAPLMITAATLFFFGALGPGQAWLLEHWHIEDARFRKIKAVSWRDSLRVKLECCESPLWELKKAGCPQWGKR